MDLYQTFNMGIGLVLIVNPNDSRRVLNLLGSNVCSEIGKVIKDESNKVYLSEK